MKYCILKRKKLPQFVEVKSIEKLISELPTDKTIYDVFQTEYPNENRLIFIGYGNQEQEIIDNMLVPNRMHYCPATRTKNFIYGYFNEDNVLIMRFVNNKKYSGLTEQDIDDIKAVYDQDSIDVIYQDKSSWNPYIGPEDEWERKEILWELHIWLDEGIENAATNMSNEQLKIIRDVLQGSKIVPKEDIQDLFIGYNYPEDVALDIANILHNRSSMYVVGNT